MTVNRQVLAEPSLDLPDRTWARLEDGTPLVTAESRGDGFLVLVHTSANTSWSSLSISGLFVEMLRRLSALSTGIAEEDQSRDLAPLKVLDGFGQTAPPGPTVRAVNETDLVRLDLGPRNPPGLYGEPAFARALNVGAFAPPLLPASDLPGGLRRGEIGGTPEQEIGPWLLTAAAILLIVDLLLALWLRGLFRLPRRALAALAAATIVLMSNSPSEAQEQPADPTVLEAALETRLAFVLTGIESLDRLSSAACSGPTEILIARTSVEPAPAQALDIERDEMIFFPMIYWPMSPDQPRLSDAAIRKVSLSADRRCHPVRHAR